jgi:hypothetical protein
MTVDTHALAIKTKSGSVLDRKSTPPVTTMIAFVCWMIGFDTKFNGLLKILSTDKRSNRTETQSPPACR